GDAVRENETQADCVTAAGYDTVVYCTACGQELSRVHTETAPAKGHTPGAAVQENPVDPTCTAAGSYEEVIYCTVCGDELSRNQKTMDPLGHTLVHVPYAEASCDEDGTTEHWRCSVCGDLFGDSQGSSLIEDPKEVVIPATGHQWSSFEYTLSADKKTVTASALCLTNPEHKVTETADTVFTVDEEAQPGVSGSGHYTAEFENTIFDFLQYETIPALPVGSCSISGSLTSYNPGRLTAYYLYKWNGEAYETEPAKTDVLIEAQDKEGQGMSPDRYDFVIQGVENGTYKLVITKTAHIDFEIRNIVVNGADVDLTKDAREAVKLIRMGCGDVDEARDGKVNLSDLNMILRNANYLRDTTGEGAAQNPDCDLNGDGKVNLTDLNIVLAAANYLRGTSDYIIE
ncbi:MAG: dockerin type I repeat-containing protein, partial [Oscillospiraceae bacterium]|nr:dockerin type I repeat-containing protein [Oscillospiraceae bacterium]